MQKFLTPRQREVTRLISLGLTNQAIADTLRIDKRIVELHINSIVARIGPEDDAGYSLRVYIALSVGVVFLKCEAPVAFLFGGIRLNLPRVTTRTALARRARYGNTSRKESRPPASWPSRIQHAAAVIEQIPRL